VSEYQFWYYCVYSWCLKTWGWSDQPQWNAALGLSLAGALNLGSLAVIVNKLGFSNLRVPTAGFVIAYFLLLLIHYRLFVMNQRYLEIAREVECEPLESQRPTWVGWVYVIGSPIVFLGLVSVLGPRNAA